MMERWRENERPETTQCSVCLASAATRNQLVRSTFIEIQRARRDLQWPSVNQIIHMVGWIDTADWSYSSTVDRLIFGSVVVRYSAEYSVEAFGAAFFINVQIKNKGVL